jgi:predicted peroxiredoxin
MGNEAVISLTAGLEDSEKVTVAFLIAVAAAESGRPALMFLTKEAVRLAVPGFAHAVACDGWRRRHHLQLLTPYIVRPHHGNP